MREWCPRCGGWIEREPASCKAPPHRRCVICGFYSELPIAPVMPDIPRAEHVPVKELPPGQRERLREQCRASRARRKELLKARAAARVGL